MSEITKIGRLDVEAELMGGDGTVPLFMFRDDDGTG